MSIAMVIAGIAAFVGPIGMIAGSIAAYAGPVGMIAAAAILVATQIYSAVTQIERIRDIVPDMTIGERIENGLLLFIEMPVTSDIANRVNANNAQKVRQSILEQQHHTYQELLKNSVDKDILFYSRGDIRLHETIHTRPSTSDTTIDFSPGFFGMDRPTGSRNNNSSIPTVYKNYSLDEIKGVNDTIVADEYGDGTDNSVVRVGNMGPPVHSDKALAQNKAALFSLGSGDDKACGYKDKRNVFMVGQGYKEFSGGNQSDTFIFDNPDIGERVSQMDGGEGSDSVTLAAPKSKGISNEINLTSGEYTQRGMTGRQHIAKISNIENVISSKNTDDIIRGNNQDNYLNGLDGEDTILGAGGNDVIALQAGFAAGGEGIDTYHILQNSTEKTVKVIISEGTESFALGAVISNILLDYSVKQISSVRRKDNGMLLEL
ncbi:calcium-binding protein, partial [Yersinia sp. Marseille-Q3913]|nr:calcium-binding protein [Yersinia sp. Marseille-Q3913]